MPRSAKRHQDSVVNIPGDTVFKRMSDLVNNRLWLTIYDTVGNEAFTRIQNGVAIGLIEARYKKDR